MHKLAVVIPGYKKEFLEETLNSIVNQTCKDFNLYIGDDASPENLYSVISKFESEIDISYKHFNENLGRNDLVGQWTRCMDLTREEEWIWLFSDDDLMDPRCVEMFYNKINTSLKVDLLHFDVEIIDGFSKIVKKCNAFPKTITVADFFAKRIKFKVNSSVVEYIFRKNVFENSGGFKNYDLGWCSDDATWMKFGKRGIDTITGSKIKWRYSGYNISSNTNDRGIVLRKLNSSIDHIIWVSKYFEEERLIDHTSQFDKLKWVLSTVILTPSFTYKEKYVLVLSTIEKLKYNNINFLSILYLTYRQIKKSFLL